MTQVSLHSITETTSIFETIRVIGDGSLQMALVCRNGKLLGTATDGDIRRAILAAVPLDSPIAQSVVGAVQSTVDYQVVQVPSSGGSLPLIVIEQEVPRGWRRDPCAA